MSAHHSNAMSAKVTHLNQTERLWHDRLGHAHIESIRILSGTNAVVGLDLQKHLSHSSDCADCAQGKLHESSL